MMSETRLDLERKQKGDSLGDRMKQSYENRSRHYLLRRTPVIIRVDGRAFHTLTASLDKPFDSWFMGAMIRSACRVAGEAQGFKLGYVQSDEASFLLTDYDELNTEAWFGYVKSKVESLTAAIMSGHFNLELRWSSRGGVLAAFDARAFNLPPEEVANYFLWRAKDWERNSISMYAQSFFSPEQLHGRGRADQHELLHTIGKNWATDLSDVARNGTFILRDVGTLRSDVQPRYDQISALLAQQLAKPVEGGAAG